MKINIKPAKIKVSLKTQKVYPGLEDLEITPTLEEQKFKSSKYGYDNVTVKAIETETLNITPTEETQKHVGMYREVNVDKINAEEKVEELDFSNTDVIEIKPSENSYLKKVTINKDKNHIPQNIANGVIIDGVEGTAPLANFEITDASYLFNNGVRLNSLYELLALCKNLASCNYMFAYCQSKLKTLDVSGLDTSQVTNMEYMFYYDTGLEELDLSNFNTENLTNMNQMLTQCSKLKKIDTSNFNTKNVTNMYGVFNGCKALEELDLTHFNTSKVEKMEYLFSSCSGLTELNVSNWDVGKVKAFASTFSGLSILPVLDLSKWKNSVSTTYYGMFQNDKLLTTLDLSGFDASNVTITNQMLKGCTGLTNLTFGTNVGKAYKNTTANHTNATLDLSDCKNLTHDSLMDVINKLYDLNLTYDVANGGTLKTQKLVLGATNIAKLTSDEIAIATNKGWVVS